MSTTTNPTYKTIKTLSFPNDDNIYKIAPDAKDVENLKETIVLDPVEVNNSDELIKAIAKALPNTVIRLKQNDISKPYDLLKLTSKIKENIPETYDNSSQDKLPKISFPENLTLEGEINATTGYPAVYIKGISITSGIFDTEINQQGGPEITKGDISEAILPPGLTIKNLNFLDSFCLRNASIDNLTIDSCLFAPGTGIGIEPNSINDVYGKDQDDDVYNFNTRPEYATLQPKNLIIRNCTFKAEQFGSYSGNEPTNSDALVAAIRVRGVNNITIYKNLIKKINGAASNTSGTGYGINLGGIVKPEIRADIWSTGKISISNNTIDTTGNRAIRIYSIKNAELYVENNTIKASNKNNNNTDCIKIESECYNIKKCIINNNTYDGKTATTANGIITAIVDEEADVYLIDYGVSGVWYYKKWSDGLAEMWGSYKSTENDQLHSNTNCLTVVHNLPFDVKSLTTDGVPIALCSGYQQNSYYNSYIARTGIASNPMRLYTTMNCSNTDIQTNKCIFHFYVAGKWR